MPPRYRELEQALLRHGFILVRSSGSHRFFLHLRSQTTVTLAEHPRDSTPGAVGAAIRGLAKALQITRAEAKRLV